MKNKMLAIAALAFALVAASANAAEPVAEIPTLTPGDSWVYDFSDDVSHAWAGQRFERVVGVQNGLPVFEGHSSNGSSFERVVNENGDEVSYHGQRFDPAHGELSFPLSVGKKWTANYVRRDISGTPAKVETKAKVVAFEKVQTPAGEFDAFRVEISGDFDSSTASCSQNETLWYAPAAKRIVKYDYSRRSIGRGAAMAWHLTLHSVELAPAPATTASNAPLASDTAPQ